MKLPYDLLKDTYVAPKVFLCETDKAQICGLETIGLNGIFKFNSYSEISFETPRTLLDIHSGEYYVNPYYDKIEALRLINIPGFGYFEIQTPTVNNDGIKESKSITAFSSEYSLSQKYISNFIINSPDVNGNIGGGDPAILSQLYDDYVAGDCTFEEYNEKVATITQNDPLVQFYDRDNPTHSLLHLALQKAYGWSIGHVDSALATQTRSFNIERSSIYDFLMNDVAQTFKCYFVFDTVNSTISAYSETSSVKFNGDGKTTTFTIIPAFSELDSVTINGYRTLDYKYDAINGIIQFAEAPEVGSIIEVNDGSQAEYQTDIYMSFENIISEMEYSYEADNIKTCLQVTGSDGMDIREANLGLDYIMDLSYFNTPDWMGQELYEAYNQYILLVNEKTPIYTECLQKYNDLWAEYSELYNRTTTDTSDEKEYVPEIRLTKLKLDYFKQMLQQYYCDKSIDGTFADSQINIIERIKEDFKFLGDDVINGYIAFLQSKTEPTEDDIKVVEDKTYEILNTIWNEFGISMLNIYVTSYTNVQQTHLDSGWGTPKNGHAHKDNDGVCDNYCAYWANYLMLNSCQIALNERESQANEKQEEIIGVNATMAEISNEVVMENHFTKEQLVRLSAFIREDEYSDENFIISDSDTTEEVFKAKKELLQCGKVELSKLCEPVLSFTAKLANIYALEEFSPIVDQFQLGNMINISLRPGYLKKARLMEVDINFEDFSDFSCTFGDLISVKSQSDIHADLLKQAASAGKSVASSSSYWDKGADLATKTDVRIQNGLLDANTRLKAIDNNQGVVIDAGGIHLQKYADDGSVDARQGRIVNNMICYTDDSWKTTKLALGEYKIDNTTYWGMLAEAMFAGYIEGSTMVANEIKAGDNGEGDYYFHVTPEGEITATKGKIAGWTIDENSIRYGVLGEEDSMWLCRNGSETEAAIGGSDATDGWSIGIGSKFGVTDDGKLYSTAGEIAGWSINQKSFEKELRRGSTDYRIYMQVPDGVGTVNAFGVESKAFDESSWTSQFSVNYEGQLYATNAVIEGTIIAKSGSIGDCNIVGGKLQIPAADIVSITADQIKGGTLDFDNIEGVKNLSADYITTGTLDANKVTIANLNAGNIFAGGIDASKVSITNLNADSITAGTIKANRIEGLPVSKVTAGSNSASVSFSDITATGGKIAGWTIDENSIRYGTLGSSGSMWLCRNGSNSSATIGSRSGSGWCIGIGSNFGVTNTGALYATSGTLSNGVNIGNWRIQSGSLYGLSNDVGTSLTTSGVTVASGSSGGRTASWGSIISVANTSSDRRLKNSISEFGEDLDVVFDNLRPIQFRYNNDPEHLNLGFVAQDVEKAFNSVNINDFGGIYMDFNGDAEYYHLLKTEFIALNTWQIQKLKTTVSDLKEEIELLKKQIASLQ